MRLLLAIALMPLMVFGAGCGSGPPVQEMSDARQAISVTERQGYILRVRALARLCAETYYNSRARIADKRYEFPPLKQSKE